LRWIKLKDFDGRKLFQIGIQSRAPFDLSGARKVSGTTATKYINKYLGKAAAQASSGGSWLDCFATTFGE